MQGAQHEEQNTSYKVWIDINKIEKKNEVKKKRKKNEKAMN